MALRKVLPGHTHSRRHIGQRCSLRWRVVHQRSRRPCCALPIWQNKGLWRPPWGIQILRAGL